ncbi:hypothetical protein BaRGS_00039054 [Batillaria attramentaria]|uniref:Uncharacterized protein n=1 Tax=Batillaria attramentaria TaxID=370345 RepID=A0ABD0J4T6_9CAEN
MQICARAVVGADSTCSWCVFTESQSLFARPGPVLVLAIVRDLERVARACRRCQPRVGFPATGSLDGERCLCDSDDRRALSRTQPSVTHILKQLELVVVCVGIHLETPDLTGDFRVCVKWTAPHTFW